VGAVTTNVTATDPYSYLSSSAWKRGWSRRAELTLDRIAVGEGGFETLEKLGHGSSCLWGA
jgi:hypothetical protein